jgi:transcriptional regulator with XRE-family HTH domain
VPRFLNLPTLTLKEKTMRKTPHRIDVEVGQRIRARRAAIGMSQEGLADHCKITFQQIQKYEKGVNRVSASRIHQIADALKCKPIDLIGGCDGGSDNLIEQLVAEPGAVKLLQLYKSIPVGMRGVVIGLATNLSEAAAKPVANGASHRPFIIETDTHRFPRAGGD